MNRFAITNPDTAHLTFNGSFEEKGLHSRNSGGGTRTVIDDQTISKSVVLSEMLKSTDDLKVFFKERHSRHLFQIIKLANYNVIIKK